MAFSRLGEDKYDLVANNCEHFANWCCTGETVSEQMEEAVWLTGELLLRIFAAVQEWTKKRSSFFKLLYCRNGGMEV